MKKSSLPKKYFIGNNRQTKIVATIGSVSESKEILMKLVQNGLNVARMNMSHGDHVEHARKITTVREVNAELGAHVAVLVDLAGPKIRIGDITTDTIRLVPGKRIILTTTKVMGTADRVYVNYEKLPQEVGKGAFIMLNDGKQQLVVESIKGNEITCRIEVGGEIRGRRGVNVPGAYLSVAAITAKDKKDIDFAVAHKAEFLAISFVRTAKDIDTLRTILQKKSWKPKIIAKIETAEAIEQFDAILEKVDGVMVARGDLAVEVPKERVPGLQKKIIRKANEAGKLVITATQMLSSMQTSPVPTRAEVSDVANAIFDGTDAVMLSEESAVGEYPVEAVATMRAICEATDEVNDPRHEYVKFDHQAQGLSKAAVELARTLGAKAIIALTESGSTPLTVSRFKGNIPIIALTEHVSSLHFLSLAHGVSVITCPAIHTIPELRKTIRNIITRYGIAEPGEPVVVVSGMTFGVSGSSNMIFTERA